MGLSLETAGTRRCFLGSACITGIGAYASLLAAGGPVADAGPPDALPGSWIAALLRGLDALDPVEARGLVRGCAGAHFEALGMSESLARFRGDLPSFLEFLREEWGWIVEYDSATNTVLADENKDDCVCPLIGALRDPSLGVLCYCSEGFAERMFTDVSGAPARAEVTTSILRGSDRCRYRIRLAPPEA